MFFIRLLVHPKEKDETIDAVDLTEFSERKTATEIKFHLNFCTMVLRHQNSIN